MAKRIRICQAFGCKNSSRNSDFCLFGFPKNEPRRLEKWFANIDMQPIVHKESFLCAIHFEEAAFTNSLRRRLIKDSVPTIQSHGQQNTAKYTCLPAFEGKDGSPQINKENASTLFPTEVISSSPVVDDGSYVFVPVNDTINVPAEGLSTPYVSIKKMKTFPYKWTPKTRKLNRYKCKIYRLKRKLFHQPDTSASKFALLTSLQKHLKPALYNIVKSQLQNSGPANGRRWSSFDKSFAFNIYLASPAAYRVLKRFLVLPSIRTLRRSIHGVCNSTGFSDAVFEVMKQKFSLMKTHEKSCVLSLDELSIRSSLQYQKATDGIIGFQDSISVRPNASVKVATHALVFMARGVQNNWKQILGFFLAYNGMPGSL